MAWPPSLTASGPPPTGRGEGLRKHSSKAHSTRTSVGWGCLSLLDSPSAQVPALGIGPQEEGPSVCQALWKGPLGLGQV